MHAIAWLAMGFAVRSVEQATTGGSFALPVGLPIGVAEAVQVADALTGDPRSFADVGDRVLKRGVMDTGAFIKVTFLTHSVLAYEETFAFPGRRQLPMVVESFADPSFLIGYRVYEATIDYIVAYLFGHELAHGFGACVVRSSSWVEKSGLIIRMAKLQAQGDVLCPNLPSVAEIKADECALRTVEVVDHELARVAKSADNSEVVRAQGTLLSISRRLAVDGLTWLLSQGLSGRTGWVQGTFTMPDGGLMWRGTIRDGYLYMPIRLALLGALMRHLDPTHASFVGLCDLSAEMFAREVDVALLLCSDAYAKRGKDNTPKLVRAPFRRQYSRLPDVFGAFVPEGVIQAWKAGEWPDRPTTIFSCK